MGSEKRGGGRREREQRTRGDARKAKADTVRLFAGIYPGEEVAGGALALLKGIDLPPHRLTRLEQVHLTVLFIGDVEVRPAGVLEEVIESVGRSAAGIGRFRLRPVDLIALPERGPVRLVALRTDLPGELVELHSRLARRLARRVRQRPSDSFLPHLTLCRLREPTARSGLREAVDGVAVELPIFEVGSVRLMRSVLGPGGASHTEVARLDLETSL